MNETAITEIHAPICPRSVKGRFRSIKNIIAIVAYSVYFFLPWVPWSRAVGPDQAVLWDLVGRKFYLFGLIIHPKEIFWLAGLLLIAALLLFFVTGIAGRVFCGYFCFQTLWTDVFVLIERLVQGERPARLRLYRQGWDGEKIRKKGLTHLLWLLFAFITGLTFTLYWGEAGPLVKAFFTGTAPFPMYLTTAILTATTYTMAGFAREQTCTHMCPYSRFQSAMFDRDTQLVSYDAPRGEGEKGRSKVTRDLKTREQRQAAGVGDCIDCGYCVQVCPTGIDIRDGLQVSCIHCALCIDACDNIMDSLEWPRGLIRYSSENEDAGKKARIVKPKNIGYGVALILSIAMLFWSVEHKKDLDVVVSQIRQPLFVKLSNGSIQNSYEVKLSNLMQTPMAVSVTLQGLENAELDMGQVGEITLRPEQQLRLLLKVRHPVDARGDKVRDFEFVVTPQNTDIPPQQIKARFYQP
jgi:cytochrome c oxidase accessory protein FixG